MLHGKHFNIEGSVVPLMMKVEDAVLKRGEEEDAEFMECLFRERMAKKDPIK